MAEVVFFELSWSILCTIGIANVLYGLLVCGITNFSQIASVPIITSASCAIANGLCYYAFYVDTNSPTSRAVASVFADIFWLVQEAGLSFYSYVILSRVLRDRRWHVFAGLFWTIQITIVILRIFIAVTRAKSILSEDNSKQKLINHLHIGYFVSIALVECVSAYFLLTKFASAKSTSLKAAIRTGLFRYLMRSTEVRLASLAVLGIMRAITYSFQARAQSATNVASQLDRFAYTMECLFPLVMLVDMLASRLVFTSQSYGDSSRSAPPNSGHARQFTSSNNQAMNFSTVRSEHVIEVQGGRYAATTSSQERIIEAPSGIGLEDLSNHQSGISRTVDFEVYTSYDNNDGKQGV